MRLFMYVPCPGRRTPFRDATIGRACTTQSIMYANVGVQLAESAARACLLTYQSSLRHLYFTKVGRCKS